jgi:hypothetical protein
MSAPNQFNDYRNYDFYFKKFDDLEEFKEEGKKAVEDFIASGKPQGQFSTRVGSSYFDPSFVKTDYNTAEKGEFIDYIEKPDLDKAIESFDAILGDIEMGGEVKKSKLKITDDKRGIFDFSLASKGLFRVVEFYSEELKNELPDEFLKFPQGIADPNVVKKNALGQFVYVSPTNNKSYFLKRRQKGTTEILNLKPDALLKTTENGIEHTVLNSYEGVKLEYKSSIKKTYLMFEKKGGKARYVDLYVVVGGLEKLEPIGMLNRTLPVLLASKILEENGIKTRIFGTRMYRRYDFDEDKPLKGYVTYTYKLKDYSQDIDFNWLAINVADPRFFRWNLWKYTSAMLQLQGLDDGGAGITVYGGNELNEVFGRYKNWYFAEMEAGREPENPLDKRLMITGGFTPANQIQEDKIKQEFFRIIDVVDFQFNKPKKAVQKIYNRFEKEYPQYNKDQIKNMTSNYVIRILSDAYAFPVGGKYATPQKEQDELTQSLEDAITAMENYFENL